tara:strand:- start:63 stop:293 length:231 start_codon:yes stop_codon:yes gene_type:complete
LLDPTTDCGDCTLRTRSPVTRDKLHFLADAQFGSGDGGYEDDGAIRGVTRDAHNGLARERSLPHRHQHLHDPAAYG